jgi:hypothetical protein
MKQKVSFCYLHALPDNGGKIYFFSVLTLALASLFLGSCTREEITAPSASAKETAVLLKLSGMNTNLSVTRAVSPDNETTINTVDVLIFACDSITDHDPDYVKTVQATRLTDSTYVVMVEKDKMVLLVAFANLRDLLPDDIPVGAPSTDVQELMVTKATDYLPNTASAMPAHFGYSEPGNIIATEDASRKVNRIPLFARVDVLSEADPKNFTLTDVYLYKYNTIGSFVWMRGVPDVPSSSSLSDTPLHYTKTPIYLYESRNVDSLFVAEYNSDSPKPADERTCLVIGGKYNESADTTYYRLDFVNKKGYVWYNIIRNHKYTFTLTGATSAGYDTPDEAWASPATNIDYDVLTWDDADYEAVVYDGVHHLAVSNANMKVRLEDSVRTIRVATDADAWSIKAVNEDGSDCDWILGLTPTSGTTTTGTDVRFTTDSAMIMHRSAYLQVTAGNLKYKMPIEKGVFWAQSNIVMKDGKLTFAATAADNAEIPADVQGLFFRWGSLMGINGAPLISLSTPYTSANVVFIPPGYSGASPTDDVTLLPWNPQGDDLLCYDDDKDKGYLQAAYDVSAGVGDVCAYISDRGWVEGRWRLPTYSEMYYVFIGNEEKDNYSILSADPPTPIASDGTDRVGSGQFRGTTTANADYLTGKMPPHVVFFPASGYLYQAAMIWYFTLSSEYLTSDIHINEVKFSLPRSGFAGIVSIEGDSYFHGATIRCVRDI